MRVPLACEFGDARQLVTTLYGHDLAIPQCHTHYMYLLQLDFAIRWHARGRIHLHTRKFTGRLHDLVQVTWAVYYIALLIALRHQTIEGQDD